MTTEEIYNFNIDNVDIEIIKDFAYFGSVINSNRDCSQDIKRSWRLRRAEIKKLEKITKSKDEWLEAKAKIIHALIFPITRHRCESWAVKKVDRKIRYIWFIWNMVLEESSVDTLDHQKDEQVGPKAN